MKENKSVITTRTATNVFIQLPSLSAVTLFRIAFGIVWLVDGAIKFLWLQPSDVIKLVQNASQGQPAWLHPWFHFWTASLTSTPTAFLHGIGLIELSLGCALVLGFLRKSAYLCGIMLSLMVNCGGLRRTVWAWLHRCWGRYNVCLHILRNHNS